MRLADGGAGMAVHCSRVGKVAGSLVGSIVRGITPGGGIGCQGNLSPGRCFQVMRMSVLIQFHSTPLSARMLMWMRKCKQFTGISLLALI